MRKHIDGTNKLDAVLLLLEILEIKTENEIIRKFQKEISIKLKEILLETTNPDWLILLLLKAREKARKEIKSIKGIYKWVEQWISEF